MRLQSVCHSLLGLAACVAPGLAHAAEPGFIVETGSPAAQCPDLAATRSAVREHLGNLPLERVKSWVARYTVAHDASSADDYVVLVLRDEVGAIRLERRIPLAGEPCATVMQAIALVLERYFRELQAPASAGEPVPPAPGLLPVRPPAAEAAATKAAEPALSPSLQLALEGGLALGSRTAVFGLELGGWFADWLYASFQPQLLLPPVGVTIHDGEGQVRGTAEVLELPLRATLALGRHTERLGWHVGPAVRLSWRRASAKDLVVLVQGANEPGDSVATGWSLAAGAGAGLTYWVLPMLGLTTSLALDAQISETQFQVQESSGAGKTPLALVSPQGQVLLGLAFGARP